MLLVALPALWLLNAAAAAAAFGGDVDAASVDITGSDDALRSGSPGSNTPAIAEALPFYGRRAHGTRVTVTFPHNRGIVLKTSDVAAALGRSRARQPAAGSAFCSSMLRVGTSRIHGRGVLAARPLRAGMTLGLHWVEVGRRRMVFVPPRCGSGSEMFHH